MEYYRVETEKGYLYGYVKAKNSLDAAARICDVYILKNAKLVIFKCGDAGVYDEIKRYNVNNFIITETVQ